jgi:hypothetical protein
LLPSMPFIPLLTYQKGEKLNPFRMICSINHERQVLLGSFPSV